MADPHEDPFAEAPGPAGDWTRLVGEAFADGATFDALRDHVADGETQCLDWCPICRLADVLRANATPELREQWSSVQREALMTLRSLIDHYLERRDPDGQRHGPRIEDIPIE